ncbi:transforming growth factor beta receptor type 3 isoform X2 [Myripristis murdjan]|uniref:transforming growth factor beta receptor type 3 isoform X2 n=1 Tax=Myripristis murdjan TaxID=586833 RepID=UPI0011761A5D|nr:transforming growth factor beta receptor type 3-like isoform X2 [Myripristis murdjan]
MMPLLSGTAWTVFCLLLLGKRTAESEEMQCPVSPVGALHPVQGLLERFKAGPGCAARESGNKETHVIAVGRASHSPDSQVTVLLKPLSLSSSPRRSLILLLSSQLPVHWLLDAEQLPSDLSVLVQLSSNSTVHSYTLPLRVQPVHSLPFRPRALLRWALKHHCSLSSLTHASHVNRVYIRLGEDPNLPSVCQLQSLFLSHNYMTSDLQQQKVQGCTHSVADRNNPEIHVIKLHSAGSGLCGSLQVEVIVSLVPPVANSGTHKVVLILSSSVPVNWAIVAHGLRGHVSVYSSNSVSPPYPPEPFLTVSSKLHSDLSTAPDLLVWANERGFPVVTSYTKADLANRFVIQLSGGGTDVVPVMNPLVVRPPWAEERRLRQWLTGGGRGGGGREAFTVQCDDGRLNVMVDRHILQTLSIPVAAVTLRDPKCQAQSNGSHFLLAFPVISCETEGRLLRQPRGVQYKNMVLLWRDKPQTTQAFNETEKKRGPIGIHISCLAAVPSAPVPDDAVTPQAGPVQWEPHSPGPGLSPGLSPLPTPRSRPGPILTLKLFVTESYEQRQTGPCVIIADHRVYVEVSAKGPIRHAAQVMSCVVSPLSDPRKSPFWTVIKDGCSTDPSLTLSKVREDGKEDREEVEDDELGEDKEEKEEEEEEDRDNEDHDSIGRGKDRDWRQDSEGTTKEMIKGRGRAKGRKAQVRGEERNTRTGEAEEEIQSLRFSFILRPVYNDSMQFLHCSLRLCVSDSAGERSTKEMTVRENDCQGGLLIPPLVSKSPAQQCEIRNLSRPMVVTQPISSLVAKPLRPPDGQTTRRFHVSQLTNPAPDHSGFVIDTGPVMGIVFAAFVMGISLMGALWCIYHHTGTSIRRESPLTEQSRGSHSSWNPSALMDQTNSTV